MDQSERHIRHTILIFMVVGVLINSGCGSADDDEMDSGAQANQHIPTVSTNRVSERPAIFESDAFARLLYDDGLGQSFDLSQTVGPATVSVHWAVATADTRVMIYLLVEAAEGWTILPSALVDPTLTTHDGVVLGRGGRVGRGGGDFNGTPG